MLENFGISPKPILLKFEKYLKRILNAIKLKETEHQRYFLISEDEEGSLKVEFVTTEKVLLPSGDDRKELEESEVITRSIMVAGKYEYKFADLLNVLDDEKKRQGKR